MSQPNPWILFMGGIAMLNVSMLVGGLHAPAWARHGGMAVCVALGLVSMGLGLRRQFQKKPERPRFVPRRKRTSSGEPRS
jgi:hypothetical protein